MWKKKHWTYNWTIYSLRKLHWYILSWKLIYPLTDSSALQLHFGLPFLQLGLYIFFRNNKCVSLFKMELHFLFGQRLNFKILWLYEFLYWSSVEDSLWLKFLPFVSSTSSGYRVFCSDRLILLEFTVNWPDIIPISCNFSIRIKSSSQASRIFPRHTS